MPTIATEQEVNLAVDVGGRSVLVRGFIDRLCNDADGRAWVVDYKTNRSLGAEALTVYGRQLAIYQRATREALGSKPSAMLVEMRTGAVHRGADDAWSGVEALLTSLVTGQRSAPTGSPLLGMRILALLSLFYARRSFWGGGQHSWGIPPGYLALSSDDPKGGVEIRVPVTEWNSFGSCLRDVWTHQALKGYIALMAPCLTRILRLGSTIMTRPDAHDAGRRSLISQ